MTDVSLSGPVAPGPGGQVKAKSPSSWLYDPKVRGYIWQFLLLIGVAFLIYEATTNAIENLQKAKIASGFSFMKVTSGFDVGQGFWSHDATKSYGNTFVTGIINTLVIAVIGCFFATLLGFMLGVARLSKNWMVGRLATVYVEVVRNVPLLLQLLVWYNAVLKPLPNPRESISIPFLKISMPDPLLFLLGVGLAILGYMLPRWSLVLESGQVQRLIAKIGGYVLLAVGVIILLFRSGLLGLAQGVFALNNRGLYLPDPTWLSGSGFVAAMVILGVLGTLAFRWWAQREQAKTGVQYPVGLAGLGLILVLPALVFLIMGLPVSFTYPQLQGFNLRGGVQIYPEFVALLVGLVTYTAAFIAEIVRAGIGSVSKGQTEAAYALGLKPGPTLKLVIIPQAMRVIIPPLTSQYLNLTKNSSLAVAIGYPDLAQIFMGTTLNQTGQAIEVISMTMAVYLTISLATAGFMNWYNSRKALVER